MREEKGQLTNILIVDDDKAIADILKDLIWMEGRWVDVCYDGPEAVERIQGHAYDLVITDLVLPNGGGIDVLRCAKEVNPSVIVILITGYASLETAITAIKEGAYDYITKPCKLDEIKIAVENAIEKARLLRENKDLVERLRDAYHELMALKKDKNTEGKVARLNFFPSNMPGLHFLYDTPAHTCVDHLRTLSTLREAGKLTDSEFKAFKKHLLKTMEPGLSPSGTNDE